MRPPIIGKDETSAVMVFPTPESASMYMEDYDIAIYTAWDANGTRLTLSPGRYHAVALADSEQRDADGLRAAILAAFASTGRSVDPKAPLSELITRAAELFRKDRSGGFGSRISRLFSKRKGEQRT